MHTYSEEKEINIINPMNAMHTNTIISPEKKREDKATRRETRYEKWKRSRKAKTGCASLWCCCFQYLYTETKGGVGRNVDSTPNSVLRSKKKLANLDTTPLTSNNAR